MTVLPLAVYTSASMAKGTVLVVDDDKSIITLVAAFLREGGYDVATALDAMQGFSIANRIVPTLILLDVNMPAGGGFQMLERLGKSSKTAGVPVVIMTASTDPALPAKLRAAGATDILMKPFDAATVLAAVQRALGGGTSV